MRPQRERILCPTCPVCSGWPAFAWVELTPWFCVNDECDVLAWDPYSSLDENLLDVAAAEPFEKPI